VNLNGTPAAGNPNENGPPYGTAEYIVAEGFRNPFGGAWRAATGAHYEVENGPDNNDRLARMYLPAALPYDFGWDGTGESMRTGALYNWSPPHAPTNIAFTQWATFQGSGFPADQMDRAFVAESGPTYASGPQALGKRIVEFDPAARLGSSVRLRQGHWSSTTASATRPWWGSPQVPTASTSRTSTKTLGTTPSLLGRTSGESSTSGTGLSPPPRVCRRGPAEDQARRRSLQP